MKLRVHTQLAGRVTLRDGDFVARGGQAAVFRHRNHAYKIYHDPKQALPLSKILELAQIQADNVLKPLDIAYDRSGNGIGYVMDFCHGAHPLCRLVTKAFKDRHQLTPSRIVDLVAAIRETVAAIHRDGCLIVDLNEMNVLVNDACDRVFFIDVDSYQTPRFPATAVMASVCDPLVRGNQFTELSDWYAWGIICFMLYVGIHPFKGTHPNYPKGAWQQRMADHASVLDTGVHLPPSCLDFGVIPGAHLEWFRAVFQRGERLVPPAGDQSAMLVAAMPRRVVQRPAGFDVTECFAFESAVVDVLPWCSSLFVLTEQGVYSGTRMVFPVTPEQAASGALTLVDDGPALCTLDRQNRRAAASDGSATVEWHAEITFRRDGRFYSVFNDRLGENRILRLAGRMRAAFRELTACSGAQVTAFDGALLQRTVSHWILMLPYAEGTLCKRIVPELDPYRIVSARAEANVLVVVGEKAGQYDRLVFVFDSAFRGYDVRIEEDVSLLDVTFAVLDRGVCVLVVDDGLEVFVDNRAVRRVSQPPFGAGTTLFAWGDGLFYVDENRIMRVRLTS